MWKKTPRAKAVGEQGETSFLLGLYCRVVFFDCFGVPSYRKSSSIPGDSRLLVYVL